MITFLFSLVVLAMVFLFWNIIVEYAVASEIGKLELGKDEFAARYNEVSNAVPDFLKQFNPKMATIKNKVMPYAMILLVLTVLSPIFAVGSLIAMFF